MLVGYSQGLRVPKIILVEGDRDKNIDEIFSLILEKRCFVAYLDNEPVGFAVEIPDRSIELWASKDLLVKALEHFKT